MNTFPCWVALSSETPHRVTLYLKLNRPPPGSPGLRSTSGGLSGEVEHFARDALSLVCPFGSTAVTALELILSYWVRFKVQAID